MPNRTTRQLPVKLKDDEVANRAQELADAEIKRAQIQARFDGAAEDWKEEKKSFENQIGRIQSECVRLSHIVTDREEPREVECEISIVSATTYRLTRIDTGEVVLERPATHDELQMELPT